MKRGLFEFQIVNHYRLLKQSYIMKLKKKAKAGSTMVELIIVGSLVVLASIFILSQYSTNSAYKEGKRESQSVDQLLQETIMLHPVNSMIKPFLYPLSDDQKNDREHEIVKKGFDAIPSEDLKNLLNKYFKHALNIHRHPVILTTNGQFLEIESEFSSVDTCSGFISEMKSTSWQKVTINHVTVSIQDSVAKDLSNLCANHSKDTFSYTLQFCYETAALPCT
ncbi:hypothetical protein [Photobacterium galatheae]|nr:hypothetical protein [Photobacterium galatheae]MCM0149039.1 hypothetical protein [Photobacterium galatheae]